MSRVTLTDKFTDALRLAHRYHADQWRKGTGIPYFSHLLQVAGLVIEAGGDEDQAIAGLLHDAVEDAEDRSEAEARRKEIRAEFGARVVDLVDGCTDGNPDEKEEMDWIDRKLRYVGHVEVEADEDVLLISVADKLHNARAILRDLRAEGPGLWSRFSGKKLGSLWYYRSLVDAYRARGLATYVGELDEVVTAIERESGRPDGVPLSEARAALEPA